MVVDTVIFKIRRAMVFQRLVDFYTLLHAGEGLSSLENEGTGGGAPNRGDQNGYAPSKNGHTAWKTETFY